MNVIKINIDGKRAINPDRKQTIVCGNTDYVVRFAFSEEWAAHEVKTARFVTGAKFQEVVFSGNECPAPKLSNVAGVEVGVYAGNLETTTRAYVDCDKSILCGAGVHDEPPQDVYNQLAEMCDKAVKTANAVEERANNGEFKGDPPVKGEDYWTNEDKEEVKEFIKEELIDTLEFKGDVEENSMPTENNVKGDVYRIYEKANISTIEKYLLSDKYIYKAWMADHDGDGIDEIILDGNGFDLSETILTSDESVHESTYPNIPINIYDASYNKIGTCDLLYEPAIPLWVVKNSTVSLTLDENYYVERTDGKTPADLEPTTVEEFEKIIKGYAIYNGESFDKFYTDETVDKKLAEVEEDYKNEIIQATGLKLIKKVTLEEDVTDVKFTFDKPLSEIVFFFAGTFDETASNRTLSINSDNRSWYMCNRGINISTSPIYYYAHAKETKERFWESHVLSTSTTSLLNGYSNNVLFISERPEALSRYVKDLYITIASVVHFIKANSTIEIWGREVDE